jgi:PTS system mannose-specific IIC component
MTAVQIILLLVFYSAYRFTANSMQIFSYGVNVMLGWVTGIICGDAQTGLYIGATMTLMGLGIGGFGGSSVPDYTLGTILGTVFSITTGAVENGLTVAVTVSMFGTQLDVLRKTLGSFFIHRAMACNEKCDFKGVAVWVWLSDAMRVFVNVLPVALAITVGADVITSILDMIPAWFTNGMKVAGGILPGLGFAILMRYMPVQKYGVFMIVGFVLSAYLNMPMLAIAGLAFVAAYMIYQGLVEKEKAKAAGFGGVAGGMEDE